MMPDAEVIERLLQEIVRIAKPLKVILFGSAARGEMTEDSDIDVLVVIPEGVHRRRTAQKLYREIVGLGVPFEVVVATTKDLEEHGKNPGLIYKSVLQEGKEIYAI